MMLRSYGFDVHDLGVDVQPDEVAKQVRRLRPDIVGLSGLLSVATAGMKDTVDVLRDVANDLALLACRCLRQPDPLT
jgi:methanogenic corrinoid protein MtbC1